MRWLSLTLWFFLTLVATGQSVVRLCTWNVRNYNVSDRHVDGEWRPAYPKPEAEKAALRAVLREINADIVALQEIGGLAYLQELQRDLRADSLDYPHAVSLAAADKDRQVAILSRLPLHNVIEHRDVDFAYFGARAKSRRGVLEVTLQTADGPWSLAVLHLKSRHTERGDDPGSAKERQAEARAARDVIFPPGSDRRLAVVGDFNDAPNSPAVRRFLRRGGATLAIMVEATDDDGDRWTHHYLVADSYDRVDYILLSPKLAPNLPGLRGNLFDSPTARLASDHRPLWIDLQFPSPNE